MGSILNITKAALGLAEDYDVYDVEFLMFVNSTLAELTQLGIGPRLGYAITSEEQTWEEFLGDSPMLNQAQAFMYLSMRLLFDPPELSSVLSSFEMQKEVTGYRLMKAQEDINKNNAPPPPEEDEDDRFRYFN